MFVCLFFLVAAPATGFPWCVWWTNSNPNSVQGAPTSKALEPQALWNFSEPGEAGSPLLGWKAGIGVSGLEVVDGKLTGRTTTEAPIIYAMRPETVDGSDLFHSLEVKARTSAAAEIRAHLSNSEEPDFKNLTAAENFNWLMEGWLEGDWVQSVTLAQAQVRSLGAVKMILLRPASAAHVTFEIESIRLISQREHRASIPSGVGWQGWVKSFAKPSSRVLRKASWWTSIFPLTPGSICTWGRSRNPR